jgi:membrane protease YdiL (CAAX protease family)
MARAAILILLGLLLVASALTWDRLWRRRRNGEPMLPRRPRWEAPVPTSILVAVLGWLGYGIFARFLERPAQPELTLSTIRQILAINAGIVILLSIALSAGFRRPWDEVGLSLIEWPRQLRLGALACLASAWPTGILLAVSAWWRSIEGQHEYLAALRNAPNWEWVVWIGVSAVIGAPLLEELLFRVILHGWLGERLPAAGAIGVTAAVFALVHGWRDALPLLPFSLIVGYLYHQTRWYWACATMHALFNGSMLTLALLASAAGDAGDLK